MPGVLKVKLTLWPGTTGSKLNAPFFAVTVCSACVWFVQVTFVPLRMLTEAGLKDHGSAPTIPTATGAGVGGGVGGAVGGAVGVGVSVGVDLTAVTVGFGPGVDVDVGLARAGLGVAVG